MSADTFLFLFVVSGFGFYPLVIFGTVIMYFMDEGDGKWKWWND
jgi:hypothetical protein